MFVLAAEEAVANSWFYENAWLIPALPAASFVLILFFGKRLPFKGAELGIAAVGTAFVLAVLTTFTWIGDIQAGGESEEEHSLIVDGGETVAVALTAEEGEEGHGATRGAPIVTEVEWFGIGTDANRVTLGSEANVSEGAAATEDHGEEAVAAEDDHSEDDEAHATESLASKFSVPIGTIVDGQSVMLLFVVTFISFLVHVYSTEYVKGDRRFTHYFAFLSLFTAAMLFMVLSSSTLQLIVGWELVGVCSFVLIGHWWEEKPNSDAALKAFFTNRVGDVGILVGMSILYFAADRSFSITTINEMAVSGAIEQRTLLIAGLCLMAAVMSKSGQFILHTWLPDAMAGPTPVSALIHAATMVVAGVYLIGRMYAVFFVGFGMDGGTLNAMAFIGGLTTVGGGLLAFVQNDIKKVLAYSTVSQLGYMVLALGVGAYTAGMFHLFTHAFFKACLFLGAGSLSHACHHSFDMKAEMGGLRKKMPITFATFVIGSLALAGIPPLAGFWSKDEILAGAGVWPGTDGNGTFTIPFIFGVITAALTAAYMTRTIWLVFFGEYRGHSHPHESPPVMSIPLVVLAFMAVTVGFLNMPGPFVSSIGLPEGWAHRFEDWVEPAGISTFPGIAHANPSLTLAIFATLCAVGAATLVWLYYRRLYALDPKATEYSADTNGLASRIAPLAVGHTILEKKYYLDHLYTDIIAGGAKGPVARAVNWSDQNILDGVVDTVGKTAVVVGRFVYRFIDQGAIDGTVNNSGRTADSIGQILRGIQTGQVRQYATLLFGAAAGLVGVFILFV
ncbi:MAG: NADH-quinone oxidoreductase subunit L [Acidimicrobiia bacterium]|nr:NADH-quinone oxidoreductase subunit L [Acidimicrobiia bacterium]